MNCFVIILLYAQPEAQSIAMFVFRPDQKT